MPSEEKLNSYFKQIFEELLDDLENIKPRDSSLMLLKTATKFLSAKDIREQFMECAYPFRDKIMSKDETFFLEEEVVEDADSYTKNEIDRIRDIWNDCGTTEKDKECIWKYLIILVKIGMKFY